GNGSTAHREEWCGRWDRAGAIGWNPELVAERGRILSRCQHDEDSRDDGAISSGARWEAETGRRPAGEERIPQHRRRLALPAQPQGRFGNGIVQSCWADENADAVMRADDYRQQQPSDEPADRKTWRGEHSLDDSRVWRRWHERPARRRRPEGFRQRAEQHNQRARA